MKRPWFLVLALIGGWLFGAQGLVNGCTLINFYNSDAAYESTEDDAQAQENRRNEPLRKALDTARTRVFPLAVAMLVLGGAMVVFAARAMGGRSQARSGLIQIACVHAVLGVVWYVLTPEVRAAQGEMARQSGYGNVVQRYVPPIELALETLASALIVLSLTRPRSRAFFEPRAQGSLTER